MRQWHAMRTNCSCVLFILVLQQYAYAQCPEQELTHQTATNWYAYSLAIQDDVMMVGDLIEGNGGTVFVYERQGDSWVETDRLVPGGLTSSDTYGTSISIDDATSAVGATFIQHSSGNYTGATYVFDYDGSAWTESNAIFPSNGSAASFGDEVDLDDDILVVGANDEVYVYERQPDTSWLEVYYMASAGSDLGWEVGVSNGIVIAPDAQSNVVNVIEKQAGAWGISTQLIGSDTVSSDDFGEDAAIDGNRIAVLSNNGGPTGNGAVYVFELLAGAWTQTAILSSTTLDYGFASGADVLALQDDVILVSGRVVGSQSGDRRVEYWTLENGAWNLTSVIVPRDSSVEFLGNRVAFDDDTAVLRGTDVSTGVNSAFVYSLIRSLADTTGTLTMSPSISLTLSQGGIVDFEISAGLQYAGQFYWLAGTFSGTQPGIDLGGGLIIPLNPDPYFNLAISSPNQPPFVNNVGLLDANGNASAQLSVTPGIPISSPVTLHHAFSVLDATTLEPLFVSGAVELCVLP